MKDLGMRVVRLADLLVGGYEVRSIEDDPALADLSSDIATRGLMNPMTVRETPEGLKVYAGHRRYAACIMAHLVEVPVHVYELTDAEAIGGAFSENFHRADVTPMEQAQRIGEVLEAGVVTVEGVAAMFRRSVDWVHDQLGLLEFPADVQLAIHRRQLSVAAGRQLAKITDDEYRQFLVKQGIEGGLTERTAIMWVAGWQAMCPVEATAGLVANPVPAAAGYHPPQSLCMGCHEPFSPDGMVPVFVCPGCCAILREKGLSGTRR